MRILLLMCCLFLFNLSYSQIPIGKDVKKGKAELIAFMKTEGFTFFKESLEQAKKYNYETKKHDIPADKYYQILFKEEISISLYFNEYENIDAIYVRLNNNKNKENFLNAIDFKNTWEYKYSNEDITGTDLIYKKGENFAKIPLGGIIQVNFFTPEKWSL